jgi:diaminohydroxyphosphoribosylaminopyrimidine deaminase/5-amino-6-(5-phosphoribosylamino)uracil reductase
VLADDPELTTRIQGGRGPLRVVVDSSLRIPATAHILESSSGQALVATTTRADPERIAQIRELGVDVEVIDAAPSGVDLKALLAVLGARGLISVLIEGGASVLGSAFDAQLVDKVVAMLAPRIIGGDAATNAVGGAGVPTLAAARLLRDVTVEHAGPDLIVTGYCVG